MTTHMGQEHDRGRLIAGQIYPQEGYAILRCGNTEVMIGYTLLSHLAIQLDSADPQWADKVNLQRAIYAITAEASLGRTGEIKPFNCGRDFFPPETGEEVGDGTRVPNQAVTDAALAMLEALEAMVDVETMEEGAWANDLARAAIAKAKGK